MPMKEPDLLRQVLDYARLMGWKSAHFRPARTARGWRTAVQGDGLGFPDLVLLRRNEMVVVELKAGRNRTTAEQNAWLAAFAAAGIPVFVWRPDDWDEIARVLGR